MSLAGHKWRTNVEAGYHFRDTFGDPRWVIRASMVLLPTNQTTPPH